MNHCDHSDDLLRRLAAPQRNYYFYGKRMDVQHFRMEQDYGKLKQWLLNRLTLGKGVLCGLEVVVDNGKLCVEPGVAIDGFGREILVPHRICLDPWEIPEECGRAVRRRSKKERHRVTLSLCYRECLTDYTPVLVSDCHTKEACAPNTIVETYCLDVRDGWPKVGEDLCAKLEENANAREDGYRVVATVAVGGQPASMAAANNGRRVVVAVDDEEPRAVVIEVGTETVIASLPGILTAPIGGASVAPEGGCAFIAHARGIAAYDIESTPPKFLFNLTDNAYGACVAGLGGKVVFAINNQTHQVDRIDVDARAVARQIDTGRGPNDLAISDDSSTLFVTDLLENQIVMVTVANNQMGVPTPTGAPARTVTATGRAAPILAYFAHRGQATRWDGNAIQNFPMAAVDPADSDITTNGRRYYVVNRDPDTRVHELVIFNREDMKELARLPVGEQPHSVTIVPRRWRAYVSNSADGTVTVVDVDSLRDRLCRLAASCGVPEDPCVVLATLELLPDGSIGPPDLCTFRTRLYSNAMLLELILCLAERIEECCGGHALPPDNPPPPAIDSLKVMEVEMISYAQPNPIPLERPDEPINITLAFNRIRVVFNRPVDQASVTSTDENTASFLVQRQPRQGAASFVHGEIGFEDPQTVLYTVTERESFERGDYTVTLFGDETPPRLSIRDQATNTRLDGEPLALPSGNGIEGGNFVFKFRVRTRD